MNKTIKETIEKLELSQPLDPFTFSAAHLERAHREFDIELARQHAPKFDTMPPNASFYGISLK